MQCASTNLVFSIESVSEDGMQFQGLLRCDALGIKSPAICGRWGHGVLTSGAFLIEPSGLTPTTSAEFSDKQGNGWFQRIRPLFSSGRYDIGIHPMGTIDGPVKSIAIQEEDCSRWNCIFRGNETAIALEIEINKNLTERINPLNLDSKADQGPGTHVIRIHNGFSPTGNDGPEMPNGTKFIRWERFTLNFADGSSELYVIKDDQGKVVQGPLFEHWIMPVETRWYGFPQDKNPVSVRFELWPWVGDRPWGDPKDYQADLIKNPEPGSDHIFKVEFAPL